MIFHQRSTASLVRLGPKLRIFMPAVLTIIETGIRNSKNGRNNVKPSRDVILCDIFAIKNIKLGIFQISPKDLLKMGYHVRCFMAFSPNDQCYGSNDDMVCDNVPILCTHVHLGMMNNVAIGSFPFRRTEKPFSIFLVPKTRCFVKQPPNKSFKMVPPHFSKILDQLTWTIFQPGYLKPFCHS